MKSYWRIYHVSNRPATCKLVDNTLYIPRKAPHGLFWPKSQVLMDLYDIFTHITYNYFTGPGVIIWLPQCQRNNPVGYDGKHLLILNQNKSCPVAIFLSVYSTAYVKNYAHCRDNEQHFVPLFYELFKHLLEMIPRDRTSSGEPLVRRFQCPEILLFWWYSLA